MQISSKKLNDLKNITKRYDIIFTEGAGGSLFSYTERKRVLFTEIEMNKNKNYVKPSPIINKNLCDHTGSTGVPDCNGKECGYFTKPYEKEKMISLLEEDLQFEQHREDNKNIYFKKDGIFFAKKMQDIVYIKSSAGKMLVKTVRDSLEISYKSNSQVLRELDSENYIKCNRAVVVNKSFIASVDSTNRYITLKDGYGILEIGTIMKKEFMKEIFK